MIKDSGESIMPDFTGRSFRFGHITALNILDAMGVDLDRVNIKAVGTYENYRGEIHYQDPAPGTPLTPDTGITLKIGGNSAVDYMPYQFFYGLGGARSSDRSWEDKARSLMAPFDAAVIRHRAEVRFNALKYEFGIVDEQHLQRFLDLFDFDRNDRWYSEDNILLWVSVLPSLYMWGGNPDIVTGILNRLFRYQFRLRENVSASTSIPPDLQYRLGEKVARLGKETVIGKSFCELDSTYEVVVCDVPPGQVKHLLPGGRVRSRIEKVLDFCMPGDLDYMIKVEVKPAGTEMGNNSFLGYSSFV